MSAKQQITTAAETVAECWRDAPDWLLRLAAACDDTSQRETAQKIGFSPSLVNQVLKNRYQGNLENVRARVETGLDADRRHCPVMGMIPGNVCLANQSRRYDPSNHIAVRLYRACRGCPHSLKGGGKKDAE